MTQDTESAHQGPHIPTALFTQDETLHEQLATIADRRDDAVDFELVVRSPLEEVSPEQIQQVEALGEGVVIVDIAAHRENGIEMLRYLRETFPHRLLVAAGPPATAELLRRVMETETTEYLERPVEPQDVERLFDRIRQRWRGREEEASGELGTLYTMFPAKRGDGCTTLAVNLAVALARRAEGRTLLVDLDLEMGEDALLLGLEPRYSVMDAVENLHRLDSDLLLSYVEHHASGLDFLAAPERPIDVTEVGGPQLAEVLTLLREHYDHIVADTSGSFIPPTTAALKQSEQVVIVTSAAVPSLRNITRMLPQIQRLRDGRGEDWVRLVVNRHGSQKVITLDEIEETVGMPIYATLRNQYQAVTDSINFGEPVVLKDDVGFAHDVRELAERLHQRPAADPAGVADGGSRQKTGGPLAFLRGLIATS